MARFINELLTRWHTGNILTKLIFVNIAVFLVLRIVAIIVTLSGGNADMLWVRWFELPSDVYLLIQRPWTVITYMFSQYGIFHLLFNVLWLYWFGRFFLFGNTPKQLFALYIYGGISGALLYIIAFNTLPYFANYSGLLLGSSASVLAIVVATAWRMPDYKVGLLFLGEIPLKWIALVIVLFSLLSVSGENAGGNIAHIGGAFMGGLYASCLGHGVDITSGFNKLIDKIVSILQSVSCRFAHNNRPAFKEYHQSAGTSGISREEELSLDVILDKIKKSGYTSLTADERKRLFNASSKLK